ncbi:MAG: hypothetical protein KAU36_07720 [candidate division Zixibacteria bacterium]|nr:hypothetical protein [candidate division Zixibacteria bacterium]
MELRSMRNWKWYTWLLLIVPGGLIVLVAGYFLLRAGGVLWKLAPAGKKWVEYDA